MGEDTIKEKKELLLLRRKLDLLLRTGRLLVESAADTSRITRNMYRVAAYLGIPEDKLHIHISYTMLLVNVSDESHSVSKFQKCQNHCVNMTVITEVSHLSWRAIAEDYSLDEYERQLDEIASRGHNYPQWLVAVMAGFACGGFCKLFGGDWIAFLFASLSACIAFRLRARCNRFGINSYMSMTIAAFAATCLAYFTKLTGLSSTPYHPVLACALFIVPGVPIINFVDDMIDNHLIVGFTRALNTLVTFVAMSFGIILAIHLLIREDMSIADQFSELSIVPHDPYYVYAIAAAVSAVGFSMIFNVERRLLWVIAIGGALTVCVRNFVNFEFGLGAVMGSFMGAFVISLIAIKAVHWFHVPSHVLTISMVIPMIPGVLIYRALLALISMKGVVGEVTRATYNGINASLIILCIAIGVAVPNIFARRFLEKSHQRMLRKQLDDRRDRGKFIEW